MDGWWYFAFGLLLGLVLGGAGTVLLLVYSVEWLARRQEWR